PRAKDNPLWLIVLCDLMMNLMLFFLVMYSFTMQSPAQRREWVRMFDASALVEDPRKRQADALVREFKEEEAVAALRRLLRQTELDKSSEVTVTEHSIRVRLLNQLLFRSVEDSLAPSARRTIALLARVLREIPNDVIIEG